MYEKKRWTRVGGKVVRGLAHNEMSRLTERFDESTERFKDEAAARFEHWAEDIRTLGGRFDCREEGAALARRMEKTADYLMYRPTSLVADDAWSAVRRSKLFWIAGGLLAGAVAYRMARKVGRKRAISGD